MPRRPLAPHPAPRAPRALRALLPLIVVLAGAPTPARAQAGPGARLQQPRARTKPVQITRDSAAGGDHWRIATGQGVLHVWRPPGYRRARAGVVVYVHGYHVSADRAWAGRLVEQFETSKQNALFVIVDGPGQAGEPVKFQALGQVLSLVRRHARLELPGGHIVVMGHSAGFRTIVRWLDYRFVDHVILLDALYSREEDFNAWLTSARHHDWHRLILVARETQPRSHRFLQGLSQLGRVVRRDSVPASYEELTPRERGARVLYLRSQYGHSEIVTGRKVIPLVLRLTRLRRLR